MVGGRTRPHISVQFCIREIQNGVLFSASSNYGEYNSDDTYHENMEDLYEALPALVVRTVERAKKRAETVNVAQASQSILSPGAAAGQMAYNPDDS